MTTFDVQTSLHSQVVNITDSIREAIKSLGITDGVVTAFVPHTTCGLTVTEGDDPTVTADLLRQMDELVPWDRPYYTHTGGNAAAHIKSALIGTSLHLIVKGGTLQLGMWQGIFLCEFDGPRIRHVWVR
ncbi:MAG TPA: secondary thiamine-phosphate synthase enzyme YjbQ [Kiritimatiellia bacterium]|jgi:secondary thiamine-phosphate synthase enzyme|nr:secondary thiamine-phosphate synthase enzyme YjbQ [Kiritimatiellia bacterium]HOM58609.1 secondary thiamine-phosphate synthase enzyme YjbQ [Kiritimatiellia bacterium]HOR97615.1 secondary thiamine-phosphate synthase enzyme YjbQ [Kiritimatiellia bacterium]HPC49665.1 secondary thiamine-phosphate synthase enzyme YjbQ [Kiritimatiellia bacterium]HPW74439.1 secondary thiamine-phosphate synthase enzyme YjbQ [Kiritimatiellia bacterium]